MDESNLPATEPQPPPLPPQQGPTTPRPGRVFRILSSELDEDVREPLRRFVRQALGDGVLVETLIPPTVLQRDLLRTALEHEWDLGMLMLSNIKFTVDDDSEPAFIKAAGKLVRKLKQRFGKPIFCFYSWPNNPEMPKAILKAGADACFQVSCKADDVVTRLKQCLEQGAPEFAPSTPPPPTTVAEGDQQISLPKGPRDPLAPARRSMDLDDEESAADISTSSPGDNDTPGPAPFRDPLAPARRFVSTPEEQSASNISTEEPAAKPAPYRDPLAPIRRFPSSPADQAEPTPAPVVPSEEQPSKPAVRDPLAPTTTHRFTPGSKE